MKDKKIRNVRKRHPPRHKTYIVVNTTFVNSKISVNKKTLSILAALVIIGLLLAGYFWYKAHPNPNTTVPTSTEMVTSKDFKISFSYPVGDNGLSLIEPPNQNQKFLKAYIMMPAASYESFVKNKMTGEAPASVSVFIFKLDDVIASSTAEEPNRITRLQNWATDNNTFSSFSLAKNTPDIFDIDGVNALHYRADGLYQQDIYLASYHGYVYMFVGQYDAETDITFTALQQLISSVVFE